MRAQVFGGEGKVVPKCECPALKSLSAGMGLERSVEPHLEMQQTGQGEISIFKQVPG